MPKLEFTRHGFQVTSKDRLSSILPAALFNKMPNLAPLKESQADLLEPPSTGTEGYGVADLARLMGPHKDGNSNGQAARPRGSSRFASVL